jgi:hypothetical protein
MLYRGDIDGRPAESDNRIAGSAEQEYCVMFGKNTFPQRPEIEMALSLMGLTIADVSKFEVDRNGLVIGMLIKGQSFSYADGVITPVS